MEQDNRVIDDIAAAKIKLLLEAERNAANAMPPGLASNNSGGSTLANLLNPSLFRGGPAARGMAGRVLRPGIEAEDSLLNRTMSGPGQVARNLGGSALAGLLGVPGDLNAMFPKPLQGALPLPTSEQLQDKFGVEANRPESFVGLVGAPDPMDLARAGGKGLLAMTLFHGTPHKFDRFALDKIGTGEGAQAYGHGLYFAENPGVAEHYKGFSLSEVEVEGWSPVMGDGRIPTPAQRVDAYQMAQAEIADHGIEGAVAKYEGNDGPIGQLIRLLADGAEVRKTDGHLYEVDIPDEITDRMLDWDAPLSEQPEIARKAVEKAIADSPIKNRGRGLNIEFSKWAYDKGLDAQKPTQEMLSRYKAETGVEPHLWKQNNPDPTGQEIYNWMRLQNDQTAEGASNALNEAGIPGIRYFDGQSRTAGEGTRNIVVFNPDDITSVKRDGELVWENRSGIRPD